MARKSTDLTLNFLGDYDSLKKTFRKATGDLDKFDKKVKGSGKNNGFRNIGKAALGAAAGIGAVSIAANEVKKSVSGTVELAKATRQLQRATGLASEDASRLAAVLKVRGMDTNKVGRSFTTLARQIEAAKTGTGAAADAFTRLGVSQKAIKSGNFNQVLLGIANGFAKLGDGTSKASVAQQLFGRNSRDLLPLLEGGSKKLREQLALAPALSQAQVKQSLAMVNAQRQVDLALMNVRTTLGTALLPVLSDGANKLAKFVTQMKTGKGAGGEFARKVKDIWEAAKPAVKQLINFGKAVFNFAAENPGVVRIAASLAAVGLALKTVKFASSISGLTTFLKAARGLGAPLRKLFSRFGTRAGAEFASESAARMAGSEGLGGALGSSGRLGKMGGKNGKFAKWGGRMGRAAGYGLVFGLVAYFGENIARAIQQKLDEIGLPQFLTDSFGGFWAPPNAGRNRYNDKGNSEFPGGRKGRRDARKFGRQGASARGSARNRTASASGMGRLRPMAVAGATVARAMRPSLNSPNFSLRDIGRDPLTGGIPLEGLLQRAESKLSRAQYRKERFQAGIGDSRSKAETRRLKELSAAAREAQREVNKLQRQISRRDALLDIRSQFKDFAQGFVDAYAQGLQNIAEARLSAAQNLADKTLASQLKNLDEEEGQSEEARRIRELRAQQERDQREREDKDYNDSKLALDTQLQRAIANGNLRGQRELQAQLDDLDQQRRDLLRNREISDLSDSLQRQRKAAQDDYEARTTAAQAYYDKQLELNKTAVDEYRKTTEEAVKALTDQLEAGKISYGEFNERIKTLAGTLTTDLKTALSDRATDERMSLGDSLTRYGTFVGNVNTEFRKIMKTLPVPEIPKIPIIEVSAVLAIQKITGLPSQLNTGGGSASNGKPQLNRDGYPTYAPWTRDVILKWINSRARNQTLAFRGLTKEWNLPSGRIKQLLSDKEIAKALKDRSIRVVGVPKRASGGMLSRSGLTMVGETGPELIAGNNVMSATRTARMNGAGVTLNVYPRTTADDPVALARALGWQLATR